MTDLKDRTILIVEDEELLKRVYARELILSGARVISASDGEEVFSVLESEKKLPDIILLDLMLPKLNGFQVLKKIKEDERWKNIPVIILTNLEDHPEYVETIAHTTVEEYLIKANISVDELMKKIKFHIDKKEGK